MGFFSSITKPFKKAFNAVKDVVGGVVDTVAPALPVVGDIVGGLLGSNSTEEANEANIALAREQMAYQRELAQNQMQWRVEDAKKAGIHPMAALGLSSMSYSPVSSNVMPTDYSYLGDMGQNINRAVMQGKTARERQQALDRQDQFDRIALRKANADADYAETLAASERLKLQRELFPPAPAVDGDAALIGGQGGSVKSEDLFTFGVDGRGKKTRVYPTDFMTSTWEDRPAGSSLTPLAEAEKLEQDAKLTGAIVNNHIWFPSRGEFVEVKSRDGQRALAYWRRVGSVPRSQRALVKYPRESMNSLDKAFFDWVDRIFN